MKSISLLFLPLLMIASSSDAIAASANVTVDHQAKTIRLDGEIKDLDKTTKLVVPRGKVIIEVVNTNTAVFSHSVNAEAVATQEGQQLNAFLKAFGPYVVDVGKTSFTPARQLELESDDLKFNNNEIWRTLADKSLADADEARQAKIQATLVELDKILDQLYARRLDVLTAYNSESVGKLRDKAGAIEQFEVAKLIEKYEAVSEVLKNHAGDDDVTKSARKALKEAPEALKVARSVERVLRDATGAAESWESSNIVLSLQQAQKVALKVQPKPIAELAYAGALPSIDTSFTLYPRWAVKPSVGLALLYSRGATQPNYGTAKATDDAGNEVFNIVESGFADNRFSYGLVLGLTTSDKEDTLWVDFTVNPSDDVKAIGIGVSRNWGIFKVGVGALWTKHNELRRGLAVGDALAAEGDLATKETYGNPDFYVSFSVTGWQPFKAD